MGKLVLNQPTLIMLYGYPGAGKTYLARQLCEDLQAGHLQAERIRYELFEDPRYDDQENNLVSHLMDFMTEEFLNAGISVVYDMSASRPVQRRELRSLAQRCKAIPLLVWLQVDMDTAHSRVVKRDHRKIDDKYSSSLDRSAFERVAAEMRNPTPAEDYIVISGKHSYQTQKNNVMKRLFDIGLITTDEATSNLVKPGMVNLIPNPLAGRVDQARRNIMIR